MTLMHPQLSFRRRPAASRLPPAAGRLPLAPRWLLLALLAGAFLLLAGCEQTGQMVAQPRYNPLAPSSFFPNGQSALMPVPGSVPFMATGSPNDPALTGLDTSGKPLKGWPVKVDAALLQLGQERYSIYCVPCHGTSAQGNGKVTGFGFPKPPDLLTNKTLSNGDIFNVITNGKGKMFSYGYRVKPPERWAIIAYLRAMQLKNGEVDPASLTPDQLNQIGSQQ